MKSRRVLGALFLGALAVRLGALAVAMATGRFPEFWEYEPLSRNLINGKGFLHFHFGTDYRAYVEPLYPWLVTGAYLVLGPFVLIRTNTGYVFWLGNHPGATGGATAPRGAASSSMSPRSSSGSAFCRRTRSHKTRSSFRRRSTRCVGIPPRSSGAR
jgi:hypothetical protein